MVCHVKAGSRMSHLRPTLPSVPFTFVCVYKPLAPIEIHSFWDRFCFVSLNFKSCCINQQYIVSYTCRKYARVDFSDSYRRRLSPIAAIIFNRPRRVFMSSLKVWIKSRWRPNWSLKSNQVIKILAAAFSSFSQLLFCTFGLQPGLPDLFVFKPKIPIWENLGGSCNWKCWYILCPFGPFHGHLVYFVAIWYI
jgi:hypothetical protein